MVPSAWDFSWVVLLIIVVSLTGELLSPSFMLCCRTWVLFLWSFVLSPLLL